jgi:hypothetical protein
MTDPREKAAECDRAIKVCTDPDYLAVLTNLRELWLAIKEQKAEGLSEWEIHTADLAKLHADIVRPPE